MTREEAIKILMGYSHTPQERAALETLIPELAESKDERIRKEIVDFICWAIDRGSITKEHRERSDSWLAYLEKQKESLHISETCKENADSFTDDEKIRKVMLEHFKSKTKETWCNMPVKDIIFYLEKLDAIPDELVKNYKLFCEEGRREAAVLINAINGINEQQPVMFQWTGKNLKEVIDFTGKSPKFGEWFKSWDEFEEYVHTHNDILKLFCEDGSHYEVPIGAWIVKTPDGYNTPSRFRFIQKPAEWSEEDEKMQQGCIDSVEYELLDNGMDDEVETDPRIAWLKSLRPQSNKEIYQAAKHDLAIKFMNYLDENRPDGKMDLSNGECEDIDKAFKENDWAKILRYVVKYGKEN